MRFVAGALIAAAIWLVVAGQVPSHPHMRLADVVAGAVITQPFGCTSLDLEPFDVLCPWHHKHTGIDLAAATGTAVRSATFGTALTGFDPTGAGNFIAVWVDAHVRVLYCHLSFLQVHAGASVAPGDVIGQVGATGLATGPHLHFQVDVDGIPVDPAAWLGS